MKRSEVKIKREVIDSFKKGVKNSSITVFNITDEETRFLFKEAILGV